MQTNYKKIIHIDMDAFYASVEQKYSPKYKNKPLIVGGTKGNYGVVTTCSYEARSFGVRSAMPISKALKLCPQAIVVNVNKELYQSESRKIMKIFFKYTNIVEPLSLDEAYLDVTTNKLNLSSATKLAKIIQQDIFNSLNLTCSCGVSYNKFLAKTASDIKKPSGIFVIHPKQAKDFLEEMSIIDFYGVGKKTSTKMINLGIYTGKDLKEQSKENLMKWFNSNGSFLYNIVRGIDNREVIPNRKIQSISSEITLINPILIQEDIQQLFFQVFNKSFNRLLNKKKFSKTITIKIKYADFTSLTRSKTIDYSSNDYQILFNTAQNLLNKIEINQRVKLLGINFSSLSEEEFQLKKTKKKLKQLKLF